MTISSASLSESYQSLRELVGGTQPEALADTAIARFGGLDPTLDHVFDLYRQTFDPTRAAGESGTFRFDVSAGEEARSYLLTVEAGTCSVTRTSNAAATVTIAVSLGDFLRMSVGETNGAVLAMSGRLTMTGDLVAAMNLADWFVAP